MVFAGDAVERSTGTRCTGIIRPFNSANNSLESSLCMSLFTNILSISFPA